MSENYCTMNEGVICLPKNYVDRTVNVISDITSTLPNVNISRDVMIAGSTLSKYIDQQLKMLLPNLPECQEEPRKTAFLCGPQITGTEINYNFLRQRNQRMWQKQAAFLLNQSDIIIFSLAKESAFNEQDEALLADVLRSFVLKS